MKHLLIIFSIILMMVGCATTKIVPVETITKIEYRDSLVYLRDTVTIEIPKERIVEVVPQLDTSRIETKLAISEAYLDTTKRTIHHTLKHKNTALKKTVDTVVVVQTKYEYLEKPIIETVEVEKPYIPTWCWIIICYAALISGLTIMRIIGKFR